MPDIHAALSFNLDATLVQAALPLFEAEQVDGLEWSFDTLHTRDSLPNWFSELIQMYGEAGRLVGHGVFFSLFSGRWQPAQAQWLAELRRYSQQFRFDHISEHFGFFTGADFHKGAPMAVPFSSTCLAIGQDRLMRIADACGCPVGLENLAFATHPAAAQQYGEFLERLVEPVHGFLILDLHNLYCQLQNFDLQADELLAYFPLHRVREIHISGGSWEPSAFRPIHGVRRDTHDDQVPLDVFELLEMVMPRIPHLQFVVMEQMGTALHTPESQEAYRADFLKMRGLVLHENARREVIPPQPIQTFLPAPFDLPVQPLEDETLHSQQRVLSQILESNHSIEAVQDALQHSILARSAWEIETWDPAMLETAWLIARKWKDGW